MYCLSLFVDFSICRFSICRFSICDYISYKNKNICNYLPHKCVCLFINLKKN